MSTFRLFSRLNFFELVKAVCSDALKIDISKLLEHLVPPNAKLTDDHIRNLIFGNYGNPEGGEKIYNEISNLDDLARVMEG